MFGDDKIEENATVPNSFKANKYKNRQNRSNSGSRSFESATNDVKNETKNSTFDWIIGDDSESMSSQLPDGSRSFIAIIGLAMLIVILIFVLVYIN